MIGLAAIMYVKMGPKAILNCGCTLNGEGEGAHILVQLVQSGKYSVIIPSTSPVQAGSRTSANERTRKESAHTEACWVQHLSHCLITCPWRVGTAALSSSRAILLPPSSFCPSNISITFKNDLPKLSRKSLNVNMLKRGVCLVCVCACVWQRQRDGGEGRKEERKGSGGGRNWGEEARKWLLFPSENLAASGSG